MSNIHKGENVISTNDMRKGIMNKNMEMKNAEYKKWIRRTLHTS